MTAGVTIRPATNADGDRVREMVFSVLAEVGLPPDPDGIDADFHNLESRYWAAGGQFLVAVQDDGSVAGSIGFAPLSEDTVELRKMYLVPAMRGRGLGREMLRRMITSAREAGYRRMVLETAAVLEAANRLYRSEGFIPHTVDHMAPRADMAYVLDLIDSRA